MKDWNEILQKGIEKYHREYGNDTPLPEGAKIAIVCDEGVMILSSGADDIDVEIIEKVYDVSERKTS